MVIFLQQSTSYHSDFFSKFTKVHFYYCTVYLNSLYRSNPYDNSRSLCLSKDDCWREVALYLNTLNSYCPFHVRRLYFFIYKTYVRMTYALRVIPLSRDTKIREIILSLHFLTRQFPSFIFLRNHEEMSFA